MGKSKAALTTGKMLCSIMSLIVVMAFTLTFNATAFAAGGMVGDKEWKWEFNEESGELTITGWNKTTVNDSPWLAEYKDKIKKVVIKEVVTLKGELFKDCANLAEVDLSNEGKEFKALKEIDGNLFGGCSSLKTVTVPKSLVTVKGSATKGPFTGSGIEQIIFAEGTEVIPEYICAGCSSLKEISFPAGVKKIRQNSFAKCTSLTEVIIPKTVVSIDGETTGPFDGCSNLTTVNFENGLTEIPDRICKGCFGITKITWPQGVTTIGKEAFYNAKEYTVNSLPGTVTAVKTNAFYMCKDKTFTVPKNMVVFGHPIDGLEEITFEAGMTKIPDSCCEGLTSLKKVNWPEGLTEIGNYAFHITKLDEIIIPDTVTKVGDGAFSKNQDHVSKIFIPDSLTTYGKDAFAEMAVNMLKYPKVVVTGSKNSKAKEIVEKFKTGKYSYTYKEYIVAVENAKVTVDKVKYKVVNPAADGTGTVAVIGFSKKTLTSVTIPDSVELGEASYKVTAMDKNTFKGMSKVKKVVIKATGIKNVSKNAFKGISAKAKIKVPKAKLKAYKKMFKKAGLSKKVKVSK